jgi:pimeloyl-ACP methyl ester carboxylesterase
MTTYVLVHGAWAGAWVWSAVRPMLSHRGHDVFTPSLSGQSERLHIGGPHIDLTTHVTDVERLITFEELSDIVLVGHSYGGMVITGVANLIPEKIKHLIYLDAFVPRDGESVEMLSSGINMTLEDGWRLVRVPSPNQAPVPAPPIQRVFGHPAGTFREPVKLAKPLEEYAFTRTYIKATEPPRGEEGSNEAFWTALERAQASPAWQSFELPTTHNAQLTMPDELTEILLRYS